MPIKSVINKAITGFPIKLTRLYKKLSKFRKLVIIVEKPINTTGNKAVKILFVKLGSSEMSKDFEAINSFNGLASTFGRYRVSIGPEIRMAGMANMTPYISVFPRSALNMIDNADGAG